jgi:hypothetical protein
MSYTDSDSDTDSEFDSNSNYNSDYDYELSIGERVHLRHKNKNKNDNNNDNNNENDSEKPIINENKYPFDDKIILTYRGTSYFIDEFYKLTLFDYTLIKYNNSYHTMINLDYYSTLSLNKLNESCNLIISSNYINEYDFIKIHDNIYKKINYEKPYIFQNITNTNDKLTYHATNIILRYCINIQNEIVKKCIDAKSIKFYILLYGTDENKKKVILHNKSHLNDFIISNTSKCCVHNCLEKYKDYKYIHIILLNPSTEIYSYATDNGMNNNSVLPMPINYNL